AHSPGLSGPSRRTLRTNLRFLAHRVAPHLNPADAPLSRERAKAPYSPAEIAGFLALAAAQPTAGPRLRAAAPARPGARAGPGGGVGCGWARARGGGGRPGGGPGPATCPAAAAA